MRAQKTQKKAAKFGFDWQDWQGTFQKLKEEVQELEQAFENNNQDNIVEELGDVLFSTVNIGRHQGLFMEDVLHRGTNKFISRFEKVLAEVDDIEKTSIKELEKLWHKAKATS